MPSKDKLPTSSDDPLFSRRASKASVQARWTFFIILLCSSVLVILLHDTNGTNAEKLVVPSYQLARSFLIKKYGLAIFVHERLRYTLLNQSPPTSEIEWLGVDVNGYKIVSVYKPPPTRLRSLDPQYFLAPVFMPEISTVNTLIGGCEDNSLDGKYLSG